MKAKAPAKTVDEALARLQAAEQTLVEATANRAMAWKEFWRLRHAAMDAALQVTAAALEDIEEPDREEACD